MDVSSVPQGTGSGFVWDDKGTVVTNFHVVKGASAIKARLRRSGARQCAASCYGALLTPARAHRTGHADRPVLV